MQHKERCAPTVHGEADTHALLCWLRRGVVSVGLFATHGGVAAAYPDTPLVDWGIFYGGSGAQLGVQILGALSIGVTTLALNGVGFAVLHALGWLRVPEKVSHTSGSVLCSPVASSRAIRIESAW